MVLELKDRKGVLEILDEMGIVGWNGMVDGGMAWDGTGWSYSCPDYDLKRELIVIDSSEK